MHQGLSKQPNMSIQNLSCNRIKNPIIALCLMYSLAKAKVVIFHELQNYSAIYFFIERIFVFL